MDKFEANDSLRQKLTDWLPLVLIFTGIILRSFGIDNLGIILNAGFFAYGTLGLLDSFKKNYHTGYSIRLLKITAQAVITLLALVSFIGQTSGFFTLLLILLDRVILTPDRLDSRKTVE